MFRWRADLFRWRAEVAVTALGVWTPLLVVALVAYLALQAGGALVEVPPTDNTVKRKKEEEQTQEEEQGRAN